MPNGFDGSAAEWKRLEAPLRSVDWRLRVFALRHMLPLSKNGRGGHEWPERSFRWGKPVSRLIQLYLKDPGSLSHSLWICATQDRDGMRYAKQATLRENVSIEEIAADLTALLREALETVRGWRPDDLRPATRPGVTGAHGAVEP
jgi:hypothetical protein